jgi:hypothetical protein
VPKSARQAPISCCAIRRITQKRALPVSMFALIAQTLARMWATWKNAWWPVGNALNHAGKWLHEQQTKIRKPPQLNH